MTRQPGSLAPDRDVPPYVSPYVPLPVLWTCYECRGPVDPFAAYTVRVGDHVHEPLCPGCHRAHQERTPMTDRGKHEAAWPRCATCGAPENAHPYRHPFKVLDKARPQVTETRVPEDPPGIDPQTLDLPAVTEAAERVAEFLRWYGDGRIVVDADEVGPPLYARDLEALVRR